MIWLMIHLMVMLCQIFLGHFTQTTRDMMRQSVGSGVLFQQERTVAGNALRGAGHLFGWRLDRNVGEQVVHHVGKVDGSRRFY